ncbi:hypothetical protein Pla108_22690 [Botrimarina colliarenosi]|uniref:J domain-containing protein n=1 Tax=Botrimarina colliarenosi TaxID=2528001 RepID=A0A5C6ADI3_9BACT|nr:J domain-containing protein [Botrimarina colliarenosi]TWT98112.1 hypothetical protein Pla108_22690 [Botrimarina colliarenosi]
MNLPPDSSDPDWGCLPRDPAGFFALPAGFDRKDLKRSYNRLLRRFKPEKHPEEFQRIRAAYEDLERELRYGSAAREVDRDDWTAAPSPTAQQSTAQPAGAPAADEPIDLESLAAAIESGAATLADSYQELSNRPKKTPPDFYALALIGDAVGPPEERFFLRWLLKGLKTWPGDPALSQLIAGYVRTQADPSEVRGLLLTISKTVAGDGFYRLTEGGWDRLLRGGSFATFVQTLAKCEENLAAASTGDPSVAGRVAFYLHALRFALWRDTSDWKERAWDFIEEHYDQLPEHLVNDFDGLMILREYLAKRGEFLAGPPLLAELDGVLEAAYTTDQLEVDRRMLAVQRRIFASPNEVAAAFPVVESEAFSAFYPLWAWLTDDIAARLAPPQEETADLNLWKGRVISLMSDLKAKKSWQSTQWALGHVVQIFAQIVSIVSSATLAFVIALTCYLSLPRIWGEVESGDDLGVGVLIALIVAALVAVLSWKWIPPLIDKHAWAPFCQRMAERSYGRVWRPSVFDFMRRSALDFFTSRYLVEMVAAESPPDERTWMSRFIQQDFGLAVYSLAQRFQE